MEVGLRQGQLVGMHPVCLGADWGTGSGDEVLHSVFDGGAAEVGHCDCWEFDEMAAKFVLGQGDGIQEEWIVHRAREKHRRRTEERVSELMRQWPRTSTRRLV